VEIHVSRRLEPLDRDEHDGIPCVSVALMRLVVETDGNRFHSTRRAIERDRRKEADLVRAGYRGLRVTWSQIEHSPEVVVLMLRAALAG
jgi:very-short-patch-repair endonuclease